MNSKPGLLAIAYYWALAVTPFASAEVLADITTDKVSVFVHGDIVTMNDALPSAEAVAMKNGTILAVGSAAKVIAAAGNDATIIDLKGNTLMPGFIDAHGHFGTTAMYLGFENIAAPPVGTVKRIDDIQRILRKKKESTPKGEWILARGYDEAYLEEGRHPTRFDLDAISSEHPIALIHVSQHLLVCNSKCLEIAGIDASTPDPKGGVFQRVAGSKEPNGVMEEQAMYGVMPILPINDVEKFLTWIKPAQDYFASFGITTLQDGASMDSDLRLFDMAAEQGLLTLDLIAYPIYKFSNLLDGKYAPSQEYNDHWRIGGVKLGLDGSPQGKTAYLTKPYLIPPPGQTEAYRGYPIMSQDEVDRYFDEFYKKGWQTLVHTNGDAVSDQMIAAVAKATKKYGLKDRRTVMIHAQTVREDQLDRMQTLQIMPSFFVSHTFYWGDWHRDSVLGEPRASRISPIESALKREMKMTLHNDSPIVPPDILHLVWTAVNRVTRSGKVLGPEQRISVHEALKGVTINAAYQNFEENSKGSIEVGKVADLVILAKNPLRVDPMTIKNIQILETIKGGNRVYVSNKAGY